MKIGKHHLVLAACVACYLYTYCSEAPLNLNALPENALEIRSLKNVKHVKNVKNDQIESVDEDDPCSRPTPAMGEAGPLGVIYAVSGSERFVEEAFLPVVEYLRFTLNIPDADLRDPDEPRWAIATEPHLCRGVLKSALPFFDVIITDVGIPIHNPELVESTSRRLKTNGLGVWMRGGYHSYSDRMKNFVKGFKVSALRVAPFKKTIYLDVDSIPCEANFQERLAKELGDADLAITPVKREGYVIPVEEGEHWRIKGKNWQAHNSACVIFNVESEKTKKLLQVWKYLFFAAKGCPIRDQIYLGMAFKALWDSDKIDHVDLDPSIFDRTMQHVGGRNGEMPSCDGSGRWLIIHKTKA